MTVPAFLASNFRYLETVGLQDVAACIADMRSELVTNGNPAWTEPVANTFRSPAGADGLFFSLTLARLSQTRLQVKVTDFYSYVISDRTIDIDAAGNAVRYFTGPGHAFVDSARTTPEFAGGAIVDTAPETVAIPQYRTVGCGHRDAAGAVNSTWAQWNFWWMWDAGSSQVVGRLCAFDPASSTSRRPCQTLSGANIFYPAMVATRLQGGYARWVGRIPHTLLCGDWIGYGGEVQVPIDAGVNVTFKVVGKAAGVPHAMLCVRKA